MPRPLRWLNYVLCGGLTAVFLVWVAVSGTERSWSTAPPLLAIGGFT